LQFWRNYRGYFFYSALLLILVGAAVGAWLICPPRVARLLPDGTTILYADAGTVRRLASLKGQAPGQLDGDYAQFVTQTGIDYERDLNAVALSIDGAAPGDGKVTGVVEGRYDRARLIGWLSRHGAVNSIYRGVDCYQMPVENRLLRVALLDKSTIAFSNLQNSAAFYATIDRNRRPRARPRALSAAPHRLSLLVDQSSQPRRLELRPLIPRAVLPPTARRPGYASVQPAQLHQR